MTAADNVKTSAGPTDQSARLMRLATYASVSVAAILISAKLIAWSLTGSVAMLSTLVDSLLDGLASIVTLVAVRHALTPADREHRFGHGKAEALAAMAQSAFVAGSAVIVLFEAGSRLFKPQPIAATDIGVIVMVGSIVLTLALVLFQHYVVKRSNSLAIAADTLHYKSDLLINIAVIAALILTPMLDAPFIDPLTGAFVALYLMFGAWRILRSALDMLMDRELPEQDRQRIREIAGRHKDVCSIHDLRTRRSGSDVFIQLHLELDGDMTLMDAHLISDQVELEISEAFSGAEVLIHQDPEGYEEYHPAIP
ncbi:MAG: cation diffusion facilitator family transporter [Alphaproteobacteria bacterium]|nr:cation diffusion facilitator family transporter [Alphaproteobacteria bacterium]